MNRMTLLLTALALGLVFLIYRQSSGTSLGLDDDQAGRVVYYGILLTVMASGLLASRVNLGETLRTLAIWAIIILGVATAYLYRNDMRGVAMRLAGGLMPGSVTLQTTSDGSQDVVIYKGINGHFSVDAELDGRSVRMMVDTGATSIALTWDDAEAIGLDPQALNFDKMMSTANGTTRGASVTIPDVTIGPITRRNVSATVSQKGDLDISLLGMNFISTLSSFEMRPDELRLRD